MTMPDLMAELAEVPLVAYAWRKEGMVGWALSHNPPTPNMLDFDKYEVRELTFRTHHAELEAVVKKAKRYDWLLLNADEISWYGDDGWHGFDDLRYADESERDAVDAAIGTAMHTTQEP